MRGVAINVGANTNEPGFRGPIRDDGRFAYVPIPEDEPTRESPPTYGDLGLDLPVEPDGDLLETPVHLDPEFAEYPACERYTYGDPFGVKARPLLDLSAGDYALFYATLTHHGDDPADWIAPDWGAYLIGHFRLARDPLDGDDYAALPAAEQEAFANNAHVKRDPFDARVLLLGDPAESRLYDRAIPLSSRERGVDANRMVTELSSDSGKGPWWRRPLRFDGDAMAEVLAVAEGGDRSRCFLRG